MRKSSLALLVVFAFHAPLFADTQDDTEHLVVTASRGDKPVSSIPNMVTIISAEDLKRQSRVNDDLSSILAQLVPGFSPPSQQLSSRGESLRGRQPLYMIDGVPQSNPLRDGSRDAHTIDISMIERIEVIQGANALHGLGASGGIINIVTKTPSEDGLSLHGGLDSSDSFNGKGMGYNAGLTGAKVLGNTRLLMGLEYRDRGLFYDADGRTLGTNPTQGDLMDSHSADLFTKVVHQFDANQQLTFSLNAFELKNRGDFVAVPGDVASNTPSSSVRGDNGGKPAHNKVATYSLDYRHGDIFWGQQLHAQLFYQDFEGLFGGGSYATYQDPALGPDYYDQSRINSQKTGLKLTMVKDALLELPVKLVYGLDLYRDKTDQDLARSGRIWVPQNRYDNLAPYLQLDWQLGPVLLTGGLRHEKVDLHIPDYQTLYSYGAYQVKGGTPSFSETMKNVGASWQIDPQWRLFASYSQGFSMPDVGRVTRGVSEPGVSIANYLVLKPIITDNRELGLAYQGDWGHGQVSLWKNDSDLGSRLVAGSDGVLEVKREATEVHGFSADLGLYVGEQSTLGVVYSQLDGRYDSNGDGDVDADLDAANVSPDSLTVYFDSTLAELDWRLSASHYFSKDFKSGSGVTTSRFDGYTLVNLSLGYDIGRQQWSLGVDNLLDKQYIDYLAQTLASDDNYQAGRGRNWRLGYRYQF
ncbi:TonB-dependent receptor [Gallaecimonas pentaromativorans]|uniref:TonB-dependent receptor n=1 Tax=Gallaecimonas pentaromativorans TaxID=584787 RepID=UPI003A8CC893